MPILNSEDCVFEITAGGKKFEVRPFELVSTIDAAVLNKYLNTLRQRDQLAEALRGILAFGIVDDALEKALAALAAIEEE